MAIILLLNTYCLYELKAQDIHFSQFFATPLNINPANTGNFEGDYRFIINNKNQWQSFANAYRTFAGSFDMGLRNIGIKKSLLGLGLQINNDVAGDGNFGTTQLYFNSAYYIPISEENKIYAGLGINIGYVHHGIDFEKLSFGNQYDGELYNPDINHEELWNSPRISYLDIGTGISFTFNRNPDFIPQAGISVFHLNTPKKGFYSDSDRYLPVKWIVNAGIDWKLNEKLQIKPLFLWMQQQKYSEYNFGALLKYDYGYVGLQSLYFGTLFRAGDAGILCIGIKYNNIRITMNYDINISKLTRISKGRGGTEFSLIYEIFKTKAFESPYYKKCPDFF